jgi:hypothetical protein
MEEREFVPYQESLSLKELGFNEPCLGHYQDRDETTLHGAVATSKNVCFFIARTNKGFIVRNSPISNCVLAPLYQHAFRWFREKYNFNHYIRGNNFDGYYYNIDNLGVLQYKFEIDSRFSFRTYEQAEIECLRKLIEIVKNS